MHHFSPSTKVIGYLVNYGPFFFLAWVLVFGPWHDAHKTLPELSKVSGLLESDTIRRSGDKTHTLYLYIVLRNCPQWFGIEEGRLTQPLDTLQQQLRSGQRITVYYEPDWGNKLLGTALHTDVYQIEIPGKVLYSVLEAQGRFIQHYNRGTTTLVVLSLFGVGNYLRRRSNS